MFHPRKGKVAINPGGSPEFQVQYIGTVETYRANGIGCTTPLVQKLWDNCPEERFLKRVTITINAAGIQIKFIENRKTPDVKIDIKDISYCCAQQDIHDRVFAWICKSEIESCRSDTKTKSLPFKSESETASPSTTTKSLQCHAVLCSSKEKAQTISLVLSRAFHIAYREWKLDKDKRHRNDKQSQILGNELSSNNNKYRQPKAEKIKTYRNGAANNVNNATISPLFEPEINNISMDDHHDLHFETINLENGSVSKAWISKIINGDNDDVEQSDSSSEGSESNKRTLGVAMAQMNIVEEDEVSFTDNNLVVEPDTIDGGDDDSETFSHL